MNQQEIKTGSPEWFDLLDKELNNPQKPYDLIMTPEMHEALKEYIKTHYEPST